MGRRERIDARSSEGDHRVGLISDILGKNPSTTMVIIDEVDADSWGIAGESVTCTRCGRKAHTDATRPGGRAAGPSRMHLLDRLLQSTDSGLGHRIVRVKLAGLLELLERRRVHLPNDVDASQIETREVR